MTGVQTLNHDQRLAEETQAREREGDPHLQSANKVISYYIGARDGDIGHAEDFVVDDEGWYIRYLVVDTRNWLPGKKAVVPVQWIDEIDWAANEVHLNLKKETLEHCPDIDLDEPLDPNIEEDLIVYYESSEY